MGRISPHIKEGAKVSVLGPVVGEDTARSLLGELWKTKRLSATVLRAAPGKNRWVISLDSQPEKEIEVAAGRMKFVDFFTSNIGTNPSINDNLEEASGSETDISGSSNSDSYNDQNEDSEIVNVSNLIQ